MNSEVSPFDICKLFIGIYFGLCGFYFSFGKSLKFIREHEIIYFHLNVVEYRFCFIYNEDIKYILHKETRSLK